MTSTYSILKRNRIVTGVHLSVRSKVPLATEAVLSELQFSYTSTWLASVLRSELYIRAHSSLVAPTCSFFFFEDYFFSQFTKMATIAATGVTKVPSSSCPSNVYRKTTNGRSSLSFLFSELTGHKLPALAASGSRDAASNPSFPVIVSPKAVSDSRNSQTCLDPDASRVSPRICSLRSHQSLYLCPIWIIVLYLFPSANII